jgi:hypothetical protein
MAAKTGTTDLNDQTYAQRVAQRIVNARNAAERRSMAREIRQPGGMAARLLQTVKQNGGEMDPTQAYMLGGPQLAQLQLLRQRAVSGDKQAADELAVKQYEMDLKATMLSDPIQRYNSYTEGQKAIGLAPPSLEEFNKKYPMRAPPVPPWQRNGTTPATLAPNPPVSAVPSATPFSEAPAQLVASAQDPVIAALGIGGDVRGEKIANAIRLRARTGQPWDAATLAALAKLVRAKKAIDPRFGVGVEQKGQTGYLAPFLASESPTWEDVKKANDAEEKYMEWVRSRESPLGF